MKEIKISKNEENQRLDKYLLKYFNKSSKAFIYKMLRKKRIKYNSKKATGNEILNNGDSLQIYLSDETMDSFMEEKVVDICDINFSIVFEDENVIFINKPTNILTHPESKEDNDTLIHKLLYYLYSKNEFDKSKESSFIPAFCNRLDRNTTGILVAGKNLMSMQEINNSIANNLVGKFYIAMVKGIINKENTIISYHKKDTKTNKVKIFEKETLGCKKIETRYKPIKIGKDYTLLEIHLITGKSHQISFTVFACI